MGRAAASVFGMAVIGNFLRGGVTRDVATVLPERPGEVDSLTIKGPGRWQSLETVGRYTRSLMFWDAMKHFRAPLG